MVIKRSKTDTTYFEDIPKLKEISKDKTRLKKILELNSKIRINKEFKIKHYKEYKFFMEQEQENTHLLFELLDKLNENE